MLGILAGCSSMGKRTVPESSVVSKDRVVENGIAEIADKFGEQISKRNVGIYKRGYRDWRLILYGQHNYYEVYIGEDGKIISSKKEDYK